MPEVDVPQIGQLVLCRGRKFVVKEVEPGRLDALLDAVARVIAVPTLFGLAAALGARVEQSVQEHSSGS